MQIQDDTKKFIDRKVKMIYLYILIINILSF